MRIIHPLLGSAFPAVRVERIDDDRPSDVFSLSVDGDRIATLTAFDPSDEVELQPDTHTGARLGADGCWRLDVLDPVGEAFDTQILFLPPECRQDGTWSGEFASWATLAMMWSCRLGPGPGRG